MRGENGSVNIIFRPTSYNKVNVGTKSSGTTPSVFDLEDVVYSAYLVVFDKDGNRVLMQSLTISDDNKSITSKELKTDKVLLNTTVCIITNVPESFVTQWSKTTSGEDYISDLDKFMQAELDYSTSGSRFSFADFSGTTPTVGIPQVVIIGETKQCIPMF